MKNRVFRDVLINLLASSVCTLALNLVVYPVYARIFPTEDYGSILTAVSIIQMIIAVLGNCLNNTRLVLNKDDNCKNEDGNYNPIVAVSSVFGSFVGATAIAIFGFHSLVTVLISAFTLLVGIARAYFIVEYRLVLDYKTQLKTNIIVSSGYICGVFLVKNINLWPLPLCLGEFLSLIYTVCKSNLVKEPFIITNDAKRVFFTYGDLLLTGIIGNILAYFDRFLINPILGATSVAIFSVASFWGKAVTPFIAPTANVMLSYLSQKNSRMTMRKYILLFLASVLPLSVFGILSIWIAPIVTAFLYPTLINDAVPYIFLASMGSLAQSSTNLLMPVLLTVCSSRTILVLQTVYFAIYLVIALCGAKYGGLMGFCISTCIIGIVKTVMYFFFGRHELKRAGQL